MSDTLPEKKAKLKVPSGYDATEAQLELLTEIRDLLAQLVAKP